MSDWKLARFSVDATPPVGHPLCGGWIKPVVGMDDPLRLNGLILLGGDAPVVLMALDWTGVLNETHRLWTEQVAQAVGTSPDRVALHCVHQHNAPFADHGGQKLLEEVGSATTMLDRRFAETVIQRTCRSARASLRDAAALTHVAMGSARVARVASARRILGPDGKIRYVRYSASRDPAVRDAPEGVIDPWLRALTWSRGDRVLARCYYYATHPMSYYGDGRVSAEFVGLARYRREIAEPGVAHLYFTGCAGNVTAGKYNDGSVIQRALMADRVETAMIAAEEASLPRRAPLEAISWLTHPHRFAPRPDLDPDRLRAIVADPAQPTAHRHRSAMAWAFLQRSERPIVLSRLNLNPSDKPNDTRASIVHLPAETFVEYQLDLTDPQGAGLAASSNASGDPSRVAVAAYGDGGPWYIPLQRSFAEGGYEPTAAFVAPETEISYRAAIRDLGVKA